MERTNQIFKVFDIKNGEELTRFYMKTDNILFDDVFEKFKKVSPKEYGINQLYCVSLCRYKYQCGLTYFGINSQIIKDKDMIVLLENKLRG